MNNLSRSYKLLGLSQGASSSAVKKAFIAASKKLHPDLNNDINATSKFVQIKEAYDLIQSHTTLGSEKKFSPSFRRNSFSLYADENASDDLKVEQLRKRAEEFKSKIMNASNSGHDDSSNIDESHLEKMHFHRLHQLVMRHRYRLFLVGVFFSSCIFSHFMTSTIKETRIHDFKK
jgi:curved DNA-binding protein CbpA